MMDREWFKPRDIKFTRQQVLWILGNAGSLREGHWPPDLPIIIKKGVKGAYFIEPVEVIAEITSRLEKCGIDGLILLAIECWGESEASLANYFRMPVWSIEKRARRALNYVSSGPARRWVDTKKRGGISYQDWCNGKRWDAKTGTYYWKKRRKR